MKEEQKLNIDSRSVDRFAQGTIMIAHVGAEGESLNEGDVTTAYTEGIICGNATIISVFPREGFPDPEDAKIWGQFVADLQKEGIVPINREPEEMQGQAMQAIADFNENGRGLFRVEYQSQWEPEDDFQVKLEAATDTESIEPPEESTEESPELPVAGEGDHASGGTLMHNGNKYTIFDVQSDMVQAEAVYSGVKPHVVSLEPAEVLGYEPPAPGSEDLNAIEFIEPSAMREDDLVKKYDQAVQLIHALNREKEALKRQAEAACDPNKNILIDLELGLLNIEQTHNPAKNREVDRLKAHYVATLQLFLPRLALAASQDWCMADHHALEMTDEDGDTLKALIGAKAEIEFSELESAKVEKGKLEIKLANKNGVKIGLAGDISNGAKTPAEPELFTEADFIEAPAEATKETQEPGEEFVIDEYGVQVTASQFGQLSDKKQQIVSAWQEIMAGGEGTKKFPACLAPFMAFDLDHITDHARHALANGQSSHMSTHNLQVGSAQHFTWMKAYKEAKAAAEGTDPSPQA